MINMHYRALDRLKNPVCNNALREDRVGVWPPVGDPKALLQDIVDNKRFLLAAQIGGGAVAEWDAFRRQIIIYPEFFAMSEAEQEGTILHEIGHATLVIYPVAMNSSTGRMRPITPAAPLNPSIEMKMQGLVWGQHMYGEAFNYKKYPTNAPFVANFKSEQDKSLWEYDNFINLKCGTQMSYLSPMFTLSLYSPLESGSSSGNFLMYKRDDGKRVCNSAETQVPPDTTPPEIGVISVSNITENSVTITWMTNEPADTRLQYGLSAFDTFYPKDLNLVIFHSATITGLTRNTLYQFRPRAQDGIGNISNGATNTFRTKSGFNNL